MNILLVCEARIVEDNGGCELVSSTNDLVANIYYTCNHYVPEQLLNVPVPCTCIYSHDFSGEYTVRMGSYVLTVDVYNRLIGVVNEITE